MLTISSIYHFVTSEFVGIAYFAEMKLIILLLLTCWFQNGQSQSPIIPAPAVYRLTGDTLIFQNEFIADSTTFKSNNWDFFKTEMEQLTSLKLVHSSASKALKFDSITVDMPGTHGAAYWIELDAEKLNVAYQSNAAQFYALNSILQLFKKESSLSTLPSCHLEDSPRFGWRGLHLDVSRHFFTVAEVKRYIDLMALYKFNVFHWHLTDDQGWRIEIKKYPELTKIGAFRDSTVIGHYSDEPRQYKQEKYGGYYTQEDVKEIVAYAKLKYITVVPEIELPGHSRAALAGYPEFSCTGAQNGVPGLWGVFDDVYCSKPETIQFMKDILSEVLTLFPSEYIHIGGDEAPKTRWKKCDDCQKVIQDEGLKDEHELQSYFIQQIDDFLSDKGRKLIGWDEILEGGLSENAAVMSWRGMSGGIEAAKLKHEVVMSPTAFCYFDYYQSAHPSEPLAIGGFLPLEKAYQFDPIPQNLPAELEQYILGGQANLWTEYIPSLEQLEYMTYPRALALSTVLWSRNKPSYEDFLSTYLNYHENYLDAHEVHKSNAVHHPKLSISRSLTGINLEVRSESVDDEFTVILSSIGNESIGGGRSLSSEDMLKLDRTKSDETEVIRLGVYEDDGTISLEQKFSLHPLVGSSLELVTPPNPKFDHNGSLTIVDGIQGRRPWIGSEWIGYTEEEIEIVLFELDPFEIDSIHIGFLNDNGSWIYLPLNVQIQVGDDLAWEKNENGIRSGVRDENFSMHIGQKGKYMRIIISAMDLIPEGQDGGGHTPWTFIDEIRISYKR
jgi:hexosaminidase